MHSDIKTIPVGMLETNCFLFTIDKTLYIIDPGFEAEKIISATEDFVFEQVIILLTHAHVDHISAVGAISKKLNVQQIYLHKNDLELYQSPANNLLPWIGPAKDLPETSDAISALACKVIHTPGHTQGGCCFLFPQFPILFTGDTLFAGCIGRTDLPGGNEAQLLASIKDQLLSLDDALPFCCGHGPGGTIGEERRHNPYL